MQKTKGNNYFHTGRQQPVSIDKLSTVTRPKAQVINYEQLKQVMLQNVGKTASKTYAQYTKERLQGYLTSPYTNLDTIRDVSNFLYRVSMPYKKIIEYYSSMLLFSYNVIYKSDFSDSIDSNFLTSYQEVLQRLENMHLSTELPNVVATVLRDGVYFGFCYDDEDSFTLIPLDPKYCKVRSISNGIYDFSFNASFFDVGNNKEFLEDEEGAWDQIFIDGYNEYKSKGNEFRWFDIPQENGLCVIAGDDPIVTLPYFISVFVDFLDLLDYQALIRSKTELENYVLLISRIPLIGNSTDVNDFAVDLDLVETTQNMLDDVVPDLVATAYTPCELQVVRFDNRNQVEQTNIYSESLSTLMSNIGMSEMIGNSNKGGSVGLDASIKTDELLAFRFLERLGLWVQRYINLNISEDFLFKFHKMTYFSKKAYVDQVKELATLGVPVKMDLATAIGYTPLETMNSMYFESALDLGKYWTPLNSSYTKSGDDATGGAPEKDITELTPEGQDTKEANKNKKEVG